MLCAACSWSGPRALCSAALCVLVAAWYGLGTLGSGGRSVLVTLGMARADAQRHALASSRALCSLALSLSLCLSVSLQAPADVYDCKGSDPALLRLATWLFYGMVFVTEVLFHVAMYLSGNVTSGLAASFDLPVLQPSYWQWYLIALYGPTHALWLPFIIECVRTVAVSFFRMQVALPHPQHAALDESRPPCLCPDQHAERQQRGGGRRREEKGEWRR